MFIIKVVARCLLRPIMTNQLSGQNNTESVMVSNLSATTNNALFVPPFVLKQTHFYFQCHDFHIAANYTIYYITIIRCVHRNKSSCELFFTATFKFHAKSVHRNKSSCELLFTATFKFHAKNMALFFILIYLLHSKLLKLGIKIKG